FCKRTWTSVREPGRRFRVHVQQREAHALACRVVSGVGCCATGTIAYLLMNQNLQRRPANLLRFQSPFLKLLLLLTPCVLLLAGCSDVFRPVAVPLFQPTGDPQTDQRAVIVNYTGAN